MTRKQKGILKKGVTPEVDRVLRKQTTGVSSEPVPNRSRKGGANIEGQSSPVQVR
jgi:hypothetical protein